MKFGAEPKKLAILGGLMLVGGYVLFTNVFSPGTDGRNEVRAARPAPAALPGIPVAPKASRRRAAGTGRGNIREFKPAWRSTRPEEKPDPSNIDPTLRTDLLAKVQSVELAGGARNVFQFGAPPPPAGPKIPVKTPKQIQEEMAKLNQAPSGPPTPPPPPPINLKYFGYSSLRGASRKRAFFLDGDDIFVAEEGEMIKKRYRVVRIGINSVEVEDTQFQSKQTLPLQQEAAG